jgi:hypothetical protein
MTTSKKKITLYLLGFLFFLAMFFAFDRGLYYLIRTMEARFFSKSTIQRLFYQKRDFNKQFLKIPKGTYNTLIMGSSRTHRGIHPHYIHKRLKQNAFKIARAKSRIKFNYLFYKEYKKIAGIPKVAIYGLDYFMFKFKSNDYFLAAVSGKEFHPPNDANETNDTNDKKDARDISKSRSNQGLSLLIKNKSAIDNFFSRMLDEWNQQLDTYSQEKTTFRIIDPFIGYDKQEPDQLVRKKSLKFETFDYTPYPGEEGAYFKLMLEEMNQDGVQVVLVFLPDYIGTFKSNHQRKRFRKDIKRLAAPLKNVHILDYNHPDKFSLSNPRYFLDGGYGKTNSHLSKTGARVLNRKLVRDIKKLYR